MSASDWERPPGDRGAVDAVARAVRLAVTLGVRPDLVRQVVARLLETGWDGGIEAVLGGLERRVRPLADGATTARAAAALRAHGARVLLIGTASYPQRLAWAWPELGAPPWVFAAGTVLPEGPAVAVVGTRRPSSDGLRTAHDLGRLLARHGVTVISGMARGIDQAAHRGALAGGGRTVAVLGTGFGVDYPARDGALRATVAAAGGLVTEHLPGAPPKPQHFLWRNRLIAGLADATVVVEGQRRSGALQTARLAAGQGRDVLAVPGSVNQPTSRGPLDLIRDGAQPVTRLDDVLEVLGIDPTSPPPQPPPGTLPPDLATVLALLGAVPTGVDRIVAETGLQVSRVLAALADLDRRGLARATPGGAVGAGR